MDVRMRGGQGLTNRSIESLNKYYTGAGDLIVKTNT
jgi:hypothetical protein